MRAARAAVEAHLGVRRGPAPRLGPALSGPSGVFVTLSGRGGALRGCIGYPLPSAALPEALSRAAVRAATADPRFPPVGKGELGEVAFEVTVLGPPEEIEAEPPEARASRVRVGRDGLMLRRRPGGGVLGILLPQVPAGRGWDAAEFLEQACAKSGLEAGAWKGRDVSVLRFGGTIFREASPGGAVVRGAAGGG